MFGRKYLSTRIKEICYKQLLRPILSYGFIAWCSISAHQMSLLRSFERKVLYKCLPLNEAYFYDVGDDCHKHIPKKLLYSKFGKIKRFDEVLYDSATRFMGKLECSSIDVLRNASNLDYLSERYDNFEERFKYKNFPPSYFYYLHLKDLTINQNVLTFFNRRYNSNSLDEYVYDLLVPD